MRTGRILHILITVLLALFVTGHILLNNKKIQQETAHHVVQIASSFLGTDVNAARVQLVYPFGITIDGLIIHDLTGDTLAYIGSATLRLKPIDLIYGNLHVTSVRLRSPKIKLSKDSVQAEANYAFLMDLFENGETKTNSNLAFKANSILIRNGSIRYDLKTSPQTHGIFNKEHINVSGLNANISLKNLESDSLAFVIRKLAFTEHSGFTLSNLHGTVNIDDNSLSVNGLKLSTPNSKFDIDNLAAGYGLKGFSRSPINLTANLQASVTGSDFKAFVPEAAAMTEPIDLFLNGYGNNLSFLLNNLNVSSRTNQFALKGKGRISTDESLIFKSVSNFSLEMDMASTMTAWANKQLSGFGFKLPAVLGRTGKMSVTLNADGDISKPDVTALIASGAGIATAALKGVGGKYNLSISGDSLNLGRLTGDRNWGVCNLVFSAVGAKSDGILSGTFDGTVKNVGYKEYIYRDLAIGGTFLDRSVKAQIGFNDVNASILADIEADFRKAVPSGRLTLNAEYINLDALNLSEIDGRSISFKLAAEASGTDLDNLEARMKIDTLFYSDYGGDWQMDNLTAAIGTLDSKSGCRSVSIFSDFFNMSLIGEYSLVTLPGSLLKICGSNLPTFSSFVSDRTGIKSVPEPGKDCFHAQATIYDVSLFQKVFHMPISIDRNVSITCYMDDREDECTIYVDVPEFKFENKWVKYADLTLDSREGRCNLLISGTYGNDTSSVNAMQAMFEASDDVLNSRLAWKNIEDGAFEGVLTAMTRFIEYDRKSRWLHSFNRIDSTQIIVGNSVWDFSTTEITTQKGRITVSGLNINNNDQYLLADGAISADSTDVINLSLNQIDLEKTLNMVGTNKMGLKGIASGIIAAAGILHTPHFSGNLDIDGFEFLDSYHGHMSSNLNWNDSEGRIEMEGTMVDGERSSTLLTGFFEPKRKFIDLNIGADHTDLHFLNLWTKKVFKEVGGRAIGDLRIFGTLKGGLNMEGEAILEDGYFVQENINTTFLIKRDTLWFEPDKMLFKNVEISDEFGHNGMMTCILNHKNFSNWTVDMKADVDGMQVYNVSDNEMKGINALVFAKGSMTLNFNKEDGLSIKADARTAPGTRLGYSMTSNVADYNFLTIIDRRELNISKESVEAILPASNGKKKTNLSLDLNVECSEDAVIDMAISSLTGTFRGRGNISAKFQTQDGVKLNGIYNIRYGQCTLSLEDLIYKNFSLLDNSYVRFNGAPTDTEFDIHTYHSVNSVSMYNLDPNINNNVRVRCLMDITGNVSNPKLSFDIDMPSATAEERDILASVTSTEEQRNLQFMYLLAIGKFYTYDFSAQDMAASGLSPSTMESIVNSTVSGQINNLLSQVLNNEMISFSSNLSASSYLSNDVTSLNNKEFEGILEAHLLDNRLLVNGNFGYRENTLTNTANFIGDIEVRYLLFPKHGISLKGYSRNNDRYFSKAVLTTQGMGVVFDKDFDNWLPKKKE